MNEEVKRCISMRKSEEHCRLSESCKGWGCRLLTTAVDELPTNEKEEAALFAKVYQEAKRKGILSCPFFHSLSIDKYIAVLAELQRNMS